jgi:hypothetical protein
VCAVVHLHLQASLAYPKVKPWRKVDRKGIQGAELVEIFKKYPALFALGLYSCSVFFLLQFFRIQTEKPFIKISIFGNSFVSIFIHIPYTHLRIRG